MRHSEPHIYKSLKKDTDWRMKCTHMQFAPCDAGMCGAAAPPQTGGSLPTDRRSKCSHSRSCWALSVLRGQCINRRSNRGTPPRSDQAAAETRCSRAQRENKSFKRTRFTQRHLVILHHWSTTSHKPWTCSLFYIGCKWTGTFLFHACSVLLRTCRLHYP